MVGTFVRAGIQAIKAIKPGTKTGAKSVDKWKSLALKSKLKLAKENLDQTLKQTDESLKKFGKTVKKQKKILED